ncbi:MAG: hypothetical protein H6Q53_1657 [Deltaproteobacteria bacterium]|nr:hypothetical protein [Deltaproteobacteria bacterium]
MKIKIVFCSLALIFSGILIMSSSASARLACDPDCLADAKDTLKGCIATCKEEFQTAKDGCRNIDHDCAEGCRKDYEGCIFDPLAELAECKLKCNEDFAPEAARCREKYPKGDPERDKCIDFYQVIAFQCKDTCREAANPLLKACSDTFKACMITCKQPPPPAP